jgi:hypothetical protein
LYTFFHNTGFGFSKVWTIEITQPALKYFI